MSARLVPVPIAEAEVAGLMVVEVVGEVVAEAAVGVVEGVGDTGEDTVGVEERAEDTNFGWHLHFLRSRVVILAR
jgi:hypothetical protein